MVDQIAQSEQSSAQVIYRNSYLAYGLHHAGIRISLANPHRSREFARGMDMMTKNDKVDAYMLACYGALKEPEPWEPPPENVRYLNALLRKERFVGDRQDSRKKQAGKMPCCGKSAGCH